MGIGVVPLCEWGGGYGVGGGSHCVTGGGGTIWGGVSP